MRRSPTVAVLLLAAAAAARPGTAAAQDPTSSPVTIDSSANGTAGHEGMHVEVTANAKSEKKDDKAKKNDKAKKEKGDKNRLTTEEIDAAKLPNAYELVDRLRRPWLRRDALTGGEVVVYMDEQNIGGPEKLRDIPAVDVAELQYLPNDQAVRRWGSAIQGSVIVVVRRR
ncbi:MAG TPA: hypothetical protein VFS11_06015 [Gemmatimonadales bacterium]|nr:hypothetical protein [Gemmatimonadales bacterium]